MSKLKNLAKMTTATVGTGTITLGSAVAGFLSFAAAGVSNGQTVTYVVREGNNTEIGRGVYTSSGTTLTRSVLKSTNSNSPISLAGGAVVMITAAAEDFDDIESTIAALDSAVDARLDTAEADIDALQLDVVALDGRLDTAESDINALEAADTSLDGRLDVAEPAILARANPNMLYNAAGRINQRTASGVADDDYCVDRWYVLTQSNPITVSQGAAASGNLPYIRITQSNASAQRMGIAQILENQDIAHLQANPGVVLSGKVRCSAATTIRFAVLAWTGTADAVTSDIVNSWTNGTFTAGNFFISSGMGAIATGSVAVSANTWTDITALVADLSGGANNVIVFAWTDSTQAQTVALDVHLKLEAGGVATPIRMRSMVEEVLRCLRYYEKSYDDTTSPGATTTAGQFEWLHSNTGVQGIVPVKFSVPKFKIPTCTVYNPSSGASGSIRNVSDSTNHTASAAFVGKGSMVVVSSGTLTGAKFFTAHWTAEAEL